MPIKIAHGRPSTVIKAAKKAGEAKAAQRAAERELQQGARIAERAMANAARLQEKQMEMDYRTAQKQQDIAIDLQMSERAKMWEIEKMELRSRGDFEREERFRQRKLDERQAKLDALEKAYDNGRGILDKEGYETAVLRETTGVAFPFKRPLTEQQKFKETMARKMREALGGEVTPAGTPAGGRVKVISPNGQTGTIEASEVEEYRDKGFTIVGGAGTPTVKPQITEAQARAGVEKYKHPSWRRFLTQSPVRTAVEVYNIRKYGL